MSNPFYNQMNPALNNIRGAYQMIMNSSNPMQVFTQIARNNPQLQPILNMLNNGANPQQLFNSLCQQRGINPQEFIKSITGK